MAPPTPPELEVKLQLEIRAVPLKTVRAPPYENALTSCDELLLKQLLLTVKAGPGVELERPLNSVIYNAPPSIALLPERLQLLIKTCVLLSLVM